MRFQKKLTSFAQIAPRKENSPGRQQGARCGNRSGLGSALLTSPVRDDAAEEALALMLARSVGWPDCILKAHKFA